jgi:hypothetical protein
VNQCRPCCLQRGYLEPTPTTSSCTSAWREQPRSFTASWGGRAARLAPAPLPVCIAVLPSMLPITHTSAALGVEKISHGTV